MNASSRIALKRRGSRIAAAAVMGLSLVVATACGSSGGSSNEDSDPAAAKTLDKHLSGETITLLIPPWADMGKDKYAEFTKLTGIKVQTDVEQFDNVHDKSVTAMQAGTAPADVIEVDWRWLPQYGAAGWLTPLDPYIQDDLLKSVGARDIFTYDDKLLAMPYALDFRWIKANMTMVKKAGIEDPPNSWDSLYDAAVAVKEKGVAQYPVGMPLSVTAETAEAWLSLTVMGDGTLLDDSGNPTFNKPDSVPYKALEFLKKMYDAGLINPGYANVQGEDVQRDIAAGKVVFDMRNGPSILYNNPKESDVADDEFANVIIGPDGPGTDVYGLPEGMGVPAKSEHKEAAAMFINWYNQAANEAYMFDHQIPGVLPAQPDALELLKKDNKLVDADQIESILPHVAPLFPGGTPTWESQFDNDAASEIQAVMLQNKSVGDALDALAAKVKSYGK